MNTIESNRPSTLTRDVVIYSGDSSLRHPKRFLRAALQDMRGAWPVATRLFRRNLAQRYRYSSLGILWAFAPSIIIAILLTVSQKAKLLGHSHVPPPFYGVFGLMMGHTFLEAMNSCRTVFTSNQQLLRRNNVHIEGLIAAAVVEVTFNAGVRLLVLIAAFCYFAVAPVATAPLALAGFAGIILLGCGIGLLLAPFSSLKRDIENIMPFLPFILFGTTPVFVEAAPKSVVASIYRFNPLAWIFDSVRRLAYDGPGFHRYALIGLLVGAVLTFTGWLLCRIWRPYIVERSLT